MTFFGQELFELAEETSGDLTDPDYLAARALCLQLTRAEGIDKALADDDLDAIVAPSYSFASSPAAVAGYPEHLSADRAHAGGQAGGPVDVFRIPAGADAAGIRLRPRTGSAAAQRPAVPRHDSADSAGCRYLCRASVKEAGLQRSGTHALSPRHWEAVQALK